MSWHLLPAVVCWISSVCYVCSGIRCSGAQVPRCSGAQVLRCSGAQGTIVVRVDSPPRLVFWWLDPGWTVLRSASDERLNSGATCCWRQCGGSQLLCTPSYYQIPAPVSSADPATVTRRRLCPPTSGHTRLLLLNSIARCLSQIAIPNDRLQKINYLIQVESIVTKVSVQCNAAPSPLWLWLQFPVCLCVMLHIPVPSHDISTIYYLHRYLHSEPGWCCVLQWQIAVECCGCC